jgi:hypothetical protein
MLVFKEGLGSVGRGEGRVLGVGLEEKRFILEYGDENLQS